MVFHLFGVTYKSKGSFPCQLIILLLFGLIERQNRQKELQELEKKLTAAHRDLREEELKMKHKVLYICGEIFTAEDER